MIDHVAGPGTITKDGVTVARSVVLKDSAENAGAKLCVAVATKSNADAGDGTTTATVLAQSMTHAGLQAIEGGANAVAVVRGIEKAVDHVLTHIDAVAQSVNSSKQIERVAAISGNDPEIGSILAKALDEVGRDGVITLEAGGGETRINFTDGYELSAGYVSPLFATTQKGEAIYDDCLVLVSEETFKLSAQAVGILEYCARVNKPVLLVCEDVEGDALSTFVMNRVKAGLPIVVVKAPYFGDRRRDLMDDLAAFVGGTFICPDRGVDPAEVEASHFGRCKQVIVGPTYTIFREGAGDVTERVNQLRSQCTGDDIDSLKYRERCAKLTQGLAIITIGAATEVELTEKRHRYEDALNATRAAVKEGIVPGGGWTLLQASRSLRSLQSHAAKDRDEAKGFQLVREALKAPAWQIAQNAGFDPERVLTARMGFNAETGKFGDLMDMGVVDPALVTKSAIRNAASIVKYVLLTECLNIQDQAEAQ